jgi:hypothetical protein
LTWVIAKTRGARKLVAVLGGALRIEPPSERDGMNLVEAGHGRCSVDALALACDCTPVAHPHTTQTQDGRAA